MKKILLAVIASAAVSVAFAAPIASSVTSQTAPQFDNTKMKCGEHTVKDDEDFLNSITREVAETLHKQRKQSKGRLLIDEIQECAKSAIRRILKHEINKSPIIIVNIGEID
jgi:mRNA degradation ribonuclease J1/J2